MYIKLRDYLRLSAYKAIAIQIYENYFRYFLFENGRIHQKLAIIPQAT